MKKIAIFFFIVIVIVSIISYLYFNYKRQYNIAKNENKKFEEYYEQQIYGYDLATVINRAIDTNQTNQVQKDKKGKYVDNDNNSINIDIKILDTDETYDMEYLYSGGMDKFVKYYGEIQFQCTKLDYHKSTNRVKYMLFEQITQ